MDIAPTYPIYSQGYNPLTKWDEPASRVSRFILTHPFRMFTLKEPLSCWNSHPGNAVVSLVFFEKRVIPWEGLGCSHGPRMSPRQFSSQKLEVSIVMGVSQKTHKRLISWKIPLKLGWFESGSPCRQVMKQWASPWQARSEHLPFQVASSEKGHEFILHVHPPVPDPRIWVNLG